MAVSRSHSRVQISENKANLSLSTYSIVQSNKHVNVKSVRPICSVFFCLRSTLVRTGWTIWTLLFLNDIWYTAYYSLHCSTHMRMYRCANMFLYFESAKKIISAAADDVRGAVPIRLSQVHSHQLHETLVPIETSLLMMLVLAVVADADY